MWSDLKITFFLLAFLKVTKSIRLKRDRLESLENTSYRTEANVSSVTSSDTLVSRTETLVSRTEETQDVITWKSLNEGPKDFDNTTTPNVEPNVTSSIKVEVFNETSVIPITWGPAEIFTVNNSTTLDNNVKEDICDRYKNSSVKFVLDKMIDEWQTVYYYQMPEKVLCFKIRISKVLEEEKQKYFETYGNFSGFVNWSECNLEIKSTSENGRKHFLQGNDEDQGVMDNVIIMEDRESDVPTVQEESADQWLVVHNLLLMRDCDTGGVIVFSKPPYRARLQDIEDALKDFNEEYGSGSMACEYNDELDKAEDGEEEIGREQ